MKKIDEDIDYYIDKVLERFGLQKVYEHSTNTGITVAYKHPNNKYIKFGYDFKDRQFHFSIFTLKGEDVDNKKMFWKIFMEMEPTLEYNSIQPDKKEYLPALKKNSELLSKFLQLWLNEGREDLIAELL